MKEYLGSNVFMYKNNRITKSILLIVILCALSYLFVGIVNYNIFDGKSVSSRELILKEAYPDSKIYSEIILDNNVEAIISEFSYNNHLAIAYFKRDELGRYSMRNAKVSDNNKECIILEIFINDKEHYVGAIDQDNLKTALITFVYENGERDYVEKEVSRKGIFLCEKPTEKHTILVEYCH